MIVYYVFVCNLRQLKFKSLFGVILTQHLKMVYYNIMAFDIFTFQCCTQYYILLFKSKVIVLTGILGIQI